MNQDLLKKYSVPVPRYTSYPPANFFHEGFSATDYQRLIVESNKLNPQHISIYIHIPFCFQLCYYCGCNAVGMRSKAVVDSYISALKHEIEMVLPLLDKSRKISQIHYGGGTPTSQPVKVLKELNEMFFSEFECIDSPEIAIECHPGYLNEKYCLDLIDAGFNRVSLGIQDFDDEVLHCVNRKPARMPIDEITRLFREHHVSINMDFIYGLPKQSIESFGKSIRQAISLRPDRLVTFSYAHVPWVNSQQLKLEEAGLPTIETKSGMYQLAKELMEEAGYKSIGLDHFVLPSDELYEALKSHSLYRNFQGYCTRRTTGQVYAFGTTGISQLSAAYSQNVKTVDEYIAKVKEGQFPITKGYELNEEQQLTREVISRLMCNYAIKWQEVCEAEGIDRQTLFSALNYDEKMLAEFSKDGIITYDREGLKINKGAEPFVRNVAASLDKMINLGSGKYSKSI